MNKIWFVRKDKFCLIVILFYFRLDVKFGYYSGDIIIIMFVLYIEYLFLNLYLGYFIVILNMIGIYVVCI